MKKSNYIIITSTVAVLFACSAHAKIETIGERMDRLGGISNKIQPAKNTRAKTKGIKPTKESMGGITQTIDLDPELVASVFRKACSLEFSCTGGSPKDINQQHIKAILTQTLRQQGVLSDYDEIIAMDDREGDLGPPARVGGTPKSVMPKTIRVALMSSGKATKSFSDAGEEIKDISVPQITGGGLQSVMPESIQVSLMSPSGSTRNYFDADPDIQGRPVKTVFPKADSQ